LTKVLSVRMKRIFYHFLARQITLHLLIILKIATWIGKQQSTTNKNFEVILTGRYDSDNWILAHLGPLAASIKCSRVWMVSTNILPVIPNVTPIYPPKWLIKFIGTTPARLFIFLWAAICKQPHVVGGFHLVFNGIAASIVGRLIGARSMYFCVGGTETNSGGLIGSTIFSKMKTPDIIVERRLLKIVSHFDTIITMGTSAISAFENKGIKSNYYVVSGGIDSGRFWPSSDPKEYDLIMTARLDPIKRVDIFLKSIQHIVKKIPEVKVVIVGGGELLDELKDLAIELDVDSNVYFVGHQDDVEHWLCRSKIFVLTSDTEGLALSLMEAMLCGLPAVVSKVGDLADLVKERINGYLVPRRSPILFADKIVELLSDPIMLNKFSIAAHKSALSYDFEAAVDKWNKIL
jgi:L-malate glycosyltransferase